MRGLADPLLVLITGTDGIDSMIILYYKEKGKFRYNLHMSELCQGLVLIKFYIVRVLAMIR